MAILLEHMNISYIQYNWGTFCCLMFKTIPRTIPNRICNQYDASCPGIVGVIFKINLSRCSNQYILGCPFSGDLQIFKLVKVLQGYEMYATATTALPQSCKPGSSAVAMVLAFGARVHCRQPIGFWGVVRDIVRCICRCVYDPNKCSSNLYRMYSWLGERNV